MSDDMDGLAVDSYLRVDVDIVDDFPEKGYFTAVAWDIRGTARTAEKAVAFALANLSEKIKSGEVEL